MSGYGMTASGAKQKYADSRYLFSAGKKKLFLDTEDLRAGLAADLNFAGPSVDTHNACVRRDNMPPKQHRQ
jgi:adenylylsulfate kinase-like enzyme